MQQVRLVALALLNRMVRSQLPLYSDTAQLVRWQEGHELTPHADNVEPDGAPNATPHRSYSSLLYLNDDYVGGETYFPGHGVRLKPEAGALVLFGAGPQYVHGVTRVTHGLRYTYAGWFTHDPQHEDRDALRTF
jgi:predicted 2-oxoglutarate/Fe(II)-dependent dioxygenase YbiX